MPVKTNTKAQRIHMHVVVDARLYRAIKQVCFDTDVKIRSLMIEILEPEIERRLKQTGRKLARPK